MFTETEINAIDEKYQQLERIKTGKLKPEELAAIITEKRVNWVNTHLEEMLEKYKNQSPTVQAQRIIYFDHMFIEQCDSVVTIISPNKIQVDSYNFCPYLEACKLLKLDTRFVCKEIGEPSIHKMIKIINPNVKFSRDYNFIRPYKQYCREFFELL